MKKWKANWKKILIVLILILLLVFGILMYGKVSELTNQLAYLQDTTNIILSDVGGMQSSIEKTLEEEASMVEDYSIEVKDMDFARHEYKVYIYSREIPGPGGMPVGTNGRAMLLLSGGIDSPVAGYMISKRGVSIDATYFHAPPYTSERAKQKVVDLAKEIAKYTGPITLHVVNFTDIQMAIYEKCPHDELTIIMRRYMMKIAEHFANQDNCLSLVTGESIGQVASQTMHSLYVTNEVCQMPVFRPCIGLDKNEIVKVAEKIGTYETSILPYEDCCTIFVAKHPVTKPRLDVIKRSERNLDDCIDELMKTAIETTEEIKINAH